MRAIQSKLSRGDKSPEVSNLHECLLFLIKEQPGISTETGTFLKDRLKSERDKNLFGPVTEDLVGIWQWQLKKWPDFADNLPPLTKELKEKVKKIPTFDLLGRGYGVVDKVTAEALNWLLRKLGAL